MTRGQKLLTTLAVLTVTIGGFGLHARSDARDRARLYCETALSKRHQKDGYVFAYHEPSDWTYESPLYQIMWRGLEATYESQLKFKTDALCIFDSKTREVKVVSLAGNDLPEGTLPHLCKKLEDIGFYDPQKR